MSEARLRKCLKCGRPFPSTGPGNRICPPCWQRQDTWNKPSSKVQWD